MDYRVLGPVEVERDGRIVPVPGVLLRRLLAALVLERRGPVAVDVLVELLWPDGPPRSAHKTLQGFVHRLRSRLGSEAIGTSPAGYRLVAGPGAVDIDALDRLVVAGRRQLDSGERAAAQATFDAALALWRGRPFPELDDFGPARAEVARLDELRLVTEEQAAQAGLDAVADIEALIADVRRLVAVEPERERRWWLLLVALRKAGRSVEALQVYEDARVVFVERFGAEPGPLLGSLYCELLDDTGSIAAVRLGATTLPPIPPMTGPFIGRRAELEALDRPSEVRLVTITGIGGAGKTRLAIEVARRRRQAREAVWFADLALAPDLDALLDTLLQLVGVPTVERGDARGALLRAVERMRGTVVLDNCEHLGEVLPPLVEALLAAGPAVRLLATSRQPLRVRGEHAPRLDPLPTGPASDATALFLARARARLRGYEPDDVERATIDEVCRRIDGLPLAIELAAARIAVSSPAQLLRGLDDDPSRLLGARPLLEHRTSLRSVLDWSLSLLDDEGRALITDLAVLPGGFDLRAAAMIAGTDDEEIAARLDRLVDAALVAVDLSSDGRQFRLLETVRAAVRPPVAAHLPVPGPATPAPLSAPSRISIGAEDRLIEWAVSVAERYVSLAGTSRHAEAISLAEAERHALRAGIDLAIGQGAFERAARIMVGLEDWWRARGRTEEAVNRCRRVAQLYDEGRDAPKLLVRLLANACLAATYVPGTEAVRAELARRARAHLAEVTSDPARLTATCTLLVAEFDETDADFATKADEALALARRLRSGWEASLLHYLTVWQLTNDVEAAAETASACTAVAARTGNPVSEAHAAEVAAYADIVGGRVDAAEERLRRALVVYESTQHLGCSLHCLDAVAWLAGMTERRDAGAELLGLTETLRLDLGRVTLALEALPQREALRSCGGMTRAAADVDALATTFDLARRIVGRANAPG